MEPHQMDQAGREMAPEVGGDVIAIEREWATADEHAAFEIVNEIVKARQRAISAECRADALQGRLRAKAILLGEFEHKIKSAFTVLAGWSRVLDEDWDRLAEDERRGGVAILRRKVEETVAQAATLLKDVEAEIHGLDIKPVLLDVAEVLRITAADYAGSDRAHWFRYEGPNHVMVRTDPAALQQVLGQLVENAAKYSAHGTTITLEAGHLPTGEVRIAVRDEGCGVPLDVDVFAPFVRGNKVSDTVPGSGLGLYIVRNLVDAMGGLVTAHRNVGPGSAFVVSVPAPDPNDFDGGVPEE